MDEVDDVSVTILSGMEGVVRTFRSGRRRLVLSCGSKSMARKLVQEGIWVEDRYFSVRPWVRTPVVGCRNCGSLDHRSCDEVRCFKCGSTGHKSMDCPNNMKCLHCGESHDARRCPVVRPKKDQARNRKQRSYRAALMGVEEPRPAPQVIPEVEEKVCGPQPRPISRTPEPPRVDLSLLAKVVTKSLLDLVAALGMTMTTDDVHLAKTIVETNLGALQDGVVDLPSSDEESPSDSDDPPYIPEETDDSPMMVESARQKRQREEVPPTEVAHEVKEDTSVPLQKSSKAKKSDRPTRQTKITDSCQPTNTQSSGSKNGAGCQW